MPWSSVSIVNFEHVTAGWGNACTYYTRFAALNRDDFYVWLVKQYQFWICSNVKCSSTVSIKLFHLPSAFFFFFGLLMSLSGSCLCHALWKLTVSFTIFCAKQMLLNEWDKCYNRKLLKMILVNFLVYVVM